MLVTFYYYQRIDFNFFVTGGKESGLDASHEDPEAPVQLKANILEDDVELPRLNITWAGPQSGKNTKNFIN